MSRQTTEADLARQNLLIAQAERLINARGIQNETGTRGLYAAGPFEVALEWAAAGCGLQVKHYGEVVLRAQWSEPDSPGYYAVTPGPWQADFLQIQAAHA